MKMRHTTYDVQLHADLYIIVGYLIDYDLRTSIFCSIMRQSIDHAKKKDYIRQYANLVGPTLVDMSLIYH